mmetsp:Transcript_39072/g.62632  ORF Transcript_39072/g.62632 Transcript_39072/m.62632 type:complete len:221 (-) Transcript_39072:617-1279(-)
MSRMLSSPLSFMTPVPLAVRPFCTLMQLTSKRFMTPSWLPMMTCSKPTSSGGAEISPGWDTPIPVRQSAASESPGDKPMPVFPLPPRACCLNSSRSMRFPFPRLVNRRMNGPVPASPSASSSFISTPVSSPARSVTLSSAASALASVSEPGGPCSPRDRTTAAGTTAIPATCAGSASPASSSSLSALSAGCPAAPFAVLNFMANTAPALRLEARTLSAAK